MNSALDIATKITLKIERTAIGKPNANIGIAIIMPDVISKLKPNIENPILLRFKAKMPEAKPKENEMMPKIPVAR